MSSARVSTDNNLIVTASWYDAMCWGIRFRKYVAARQSTQTVARRNYDTGAALLENIAQTMGCERGADRLWDSSEEWCRWSSADLSILGVV